MTFDPLIAALDARLAAIEAAKPYRMEAALLEAIQQYQAAAAAGIVRPPHPSSQTPEGRIECAKLVTAIEAYQERHRERERIAERPHAHFELQAELVAVETVPTSQIGDTLRPRRPRDPPPKKAYRPDATDERGPSPGQWNDPAPGALPDGVDRLDVEVYGASEAFAQRREAMLPGETPFEFEARCKRGKANAAKAESWFARLRRMTNGSGGDGGAGWMGS
jgi:hypothetical protein